MTRFSLAAVLPVPRVACWTGWIRHGVLWRWWRWVFGLLRDAFNAAMDAGPAA